MSETPPLSAVLNGRKYVVTLHPGTDGMRLSLRLSAMAVGIMAQALKPGANLQALMAGQTAGLSFGDMIASVQAMLDHPDAAQMIRDCLRFTTCDGKPLSDDAVFDLTFQGNYGEMFDVLVLAIRGNGFLAARAILRAASAGMPKRPPASTPAAGASPSPTPS